MPAMGDDGRAMPYRPRKQRPPKKGKIVTYDPKQGGPGSPRHPNTGGAPGRGKTVTFNPNMARGVKGAGGGISPRYKTSSFNPFANGGVSAGTRIKRGADNHPNEGDSDYTPRRRRR